MRPRLLIQMNSDPDLPLAWLALDGDGRPEGGTESGSPADASLAAAGREVIGLAPGADVLLISAQVPSLSRQRLARAVPYALEDQLAADVESLHFAIAPRTADGQVPVAVVAHERMVTWLDQFKSAGLQVEHIYPDVLALPHRADVWAVAVAEDRFLLRTGEYSGASGDLTVAEVMLRAALADVGEARPELVLVVPIGETQAEFGDLPIPVEYAAGIPSTLHLFAEHLLPRPRLDLMSGPYAPNIETRRTWRRWRVAAALLLACAAADTGRAYLKERQAETRFQALNQEIKGIYRRTFPGEHRVPDPRLQMESRLATLRRRAAGGGDAFLSRLAQIGPALTQDPTVRLTSLDYQGGDLELEFEANNLQSIDRLKHRLSTLSGLSVTVQSAKAEGNRVQARLKVASSS